MTDKEILQLPSNDALEHFYTKYHVHVLRYCYALINDEMHAEDIAANTFLELQRKIASFQWQGISIKAWLMKTAKFKFYSHIKKYGKEDLYPEFFSRLPDSRENLAEKAVNNVVIKQIIEELHLLPKSDQEILMLRLWESLQFKEIAEIIGSNPDTVKIKYYRAIKKLKAHITGVKTEKEIRTFIIYLGNFPDSNTKLPFSFSKNIPYNQFIKIIIPVVTITSIISPIPVRIISRAPQQPVTQNITMVTEEAVAPTILPEHDESTTIPSHTITTTAIPEPIKTPNPTSPQINPALIKSSPTATATATPTNTPLPNLLQGSVTLYYPNTKLITIYYPSNWEILTQGIGTCESEIETRPASCAFFYLYSPNDNASLELNISQSHDIRIHPYAGTSFGPAVGTANLFGKTITKNSASPNRLYYNDGNEVFYSDLKLTAYLYSGTITTYMNTSHALSPNFITTSDTVLQAMTYK